MALIDLEVSPRQETGKNPNRRLRVAGTIPAVIYGHGDNAKISVSLRSLQLAMIKGDGSRSILRVKGAGLDGTTVVIRELQRHPVTDRIIHADLGRVRMDEKIVFTVPITLVGQAPGVKFGGFLSQLLRKVEVRCTPDLVPSHLDADISGLQLGKSLHVSDLQVGQGVEILTPAEDPIAIVAIPRGTKEEATAAEPGTAVAEPEVIKKGKVVEEGAEEDKGKKK